MRDKFTITISDVNGSKHYLLHQIVKKFVLYIVLFILFLLAVGSFVISYLMKEVSLLEDKKEKIEKEYIETKKELERKYDIFKRRLELEAKKLRENNEKLKLEIKTKAKEYEAIKEKVNDIEELVGLKPTENVDEDLGDRLEKLSFTSRQRQIIFQNIPNGEPVPFNGYSGKFGWRIHPILKKKEFHRGLDLRAKARTPIKAPADGVVEFAGFHKRSGFGNLIILDHNYGFKTSYGHLYKIAVKSGQFVKKGDIIGYVGSSGLSTGPHLHYEVRFVARALNPYYFVKWNGSNFKEIFKKEKRVPWESLIKMINNQYQLQRQQLSQQGQK